MADPKKPNDDERIEELLSQLQGIFGKLSQSDDEESQDKEDLPVARAKPPLEVPPEPPPAEEPPAPPPAVEPSIEPVHEATPTPPEISEPIAPEPPPISPEPPAPLVEEAPPATFEQNYVPEPPVIEPLPAPEPPPPEPVAPPIEFDEPPESPTPSAPIVEPAFTPFAPPEPPAPAKPPAAPEPTPPPEPEPPAPAPALDPSETPTVIFFPAGREAECQILSEKVETLTPKFTKVTFQLRVVSSIAYDAKGEWKETLLAHVKPDVVKAVFLIVDRPMDETRRRAFQQALDPLQIYFQEVPVMSIEKKAFYTDLLLGLVFFFDSSKPKNSPENQP